MNRKKLLVIGGLKPLQPSAGCIRMRTKAWLLARDITGLKRHALGFLAALAILFGTSATAAAADWYVNDATGNDLNTCTSALMPCKTIQAAVNKASANDTIHVAAGLYLEALPGPLTINKTLTLLGAQAGVDARTRVGAESIINDVQGTSVSASDVVIDGFTVQNSTVAAFTGYGIWLNPSVSGTQIINNIIQDNIVGIGLANAGASPAQALIRHNLIRNNTQPGGASGSGIYTDEFVGGPTVRNVLVQENTFSGHAGFGGAINISNTDPAGGVFNLDVDTNSFDTNSRAFVLFNTHNSMIHDNTSTGSTFVLSADVRIFDSNTNLSILRNDLMMGVGHAIRLSNLGILGPSSSVQIHFNNIEVFGLTGLTVDVGSHVGTVNAECNWWNSPSGPTNPSNPGGTGEEVVGDADFTPWLLTRYPAPCIGGVSGKVTGGGQVDVPGGKGTFGFNAKQEGGVTSGHLNYVNHVTGTHLDCTVTAITEFTATTAKFSGTCRNSTANSFSAEVEDNGEPGKNVDKFKITYGANIGEGGPGPIRSGNIQIHR